MSIKNENFLKELKERKVRPTFLYEHFDILHIRQLTQTLELQQLKTERTTYIDRIIENPTLAPIFEKFIEGLNITTKENNLDKLLSEIDKFSQTNEVMPSSKGFLKL